MNISVKFVFVLAVIALVFISPNSFAAMQKPGSSKVNPDQPLTKQAKKVDSKFLEINEDDIVIGSPDAPVTIIEYSSLSCPHCGYYHNDVFKHIKSKYILNMKVRYILRDFPLNSAALLATKIAHCTGKDRYYDFVDTLFEWQDQWAFTREYMYPLEKIAKLGGISEEKYKECVNDKELEDFILLRAMKANNKLEIDQTPTFFINGERFSGAKPFSFYAEKIDKKLLELDK